MGIFQPNKISVGKDFVVCLFAKSDGMTILSRNVFLK